MLPQYGLIAPDVGNGSRVSLTDASRVSLPSKTRRADILVWEQRATAHTAWDHFISRPTTFHSFQLFDIAMSAC
jgi:hypothetical protein